MKRLEWPTLVTLALCYAVWVIGTVWLPTFSVVLAVVLTALAIALHASLQHETIHGHPFKNEALNAMLVFPALCLFIPYLRFKDTHIEHHRDSNLTDPYDDPETQYLDPSVWNWMPRWLQATLTFNNTLLGRVLIGNVVSQIAFMIGDWRAIRKGNHRITLGWVLHIPAVALVLAWLVFVSPMSIWAYIIASYIGLAIIKIRTFLEHQAHERVAGRTVIIEDRGPLAFLFLNNNFHVVHHAHPKVPWYKLPGLYAKHRQRYAAQNGGYVYRSYAQIIGRFFLQAKEQVPHPFWR